MRTHERRIDLFERVRAQREEIVITRRLVYKNRLIRYEGWVMGATAGIDHRALRVLCKYVNAKPVESLSLTRSCCSLGMAGRGKG